MGRCGNRTFDQAFAEELHAGKSVDHGIVPDQPPQKLRSIFIRIRNGRRRFIRNMKKGIVFIEPFLPEERNQDSRQLRQELFVFRGVCGDMPAETFLFDACDISKCSKPARFAVSIQRSRSEKSN